MSPLVVRAISTTIDGVTYQRNDVIPDGVDASRHLERGVVVDPGQEVVAEAPEVASGVLPDPLDATTAALAKAIAEVTAPQVVEHAAGDPARAKALLKAEKHGGDPRKTVVEPLAKIAEDGGA